MYYRSIDGGMNMVAGYEAMSIIWEGQIRRLAEDDAAVRLRFFESTFGTAVLTPLGL